jgi:hypothetical protein
MPSPLGLKPCIGLAGIVQKSQNGQAHQVDLGEWPTCCPHHNARRTESTCAMAQKQAATSSMCAVNG